MPECEIRVLPPPQCCACGQHSEDYALLQERAFCPECRGECEECGEELPRVQLASTDIGNHEALCEQCIGICDDCGNTGRANEMGSDWHGNTLCDDCTFTCRDCEETYREGDLDEHGHCDRCSIVCPGCGGHFADRDDFYGDRCQSCGEDYSFCDECENEYRSADGECPNCTGSAYIHDYSFKPAPKWAWGAKEKRDLKALFLGVELEIECKDANRRIGDDVEAFIGPETQFYAKQDGSLSHGVEIVSHPATYTWWREAGLAWVDSFRMSGYRSYQTSTCGMHVHVSRAGLGKAGVFRLLEFVKRNATVIRGLSRRPLANMERWAAIDCRDTTGLVRKALYKEDVGRYEAINVVPSATVEFRFFRGTLDKVAFRRNLDLVQALCGFVRHSGNKALAFSDFTAWLRGKRAEAFLKRKAIDGLLAWFKDYSVEKEEVCA